MRVLKYIFVTSLILLVAACSSRNPDPLIKEDVQASAQEDFELLKSWLREIKFDRLGCFTYSHEENTGAYDLVDNVPEIVKNQRLNDIMELQSQISWELNQNRVGETFKVLIDRKRGNYYIGRTQFDSPDVDNEVLIDAKSNFLKVGEFVNAKIIDASDFDLYAEV